MELSLADVLDGLISWSGSGKGTRVQFRVRELPGERNFQALDIEESVRREELLARTRPAYEAIQNVGEAEFHRAAVEQARGQLRDGLPLRAEINVVGYLARKPEGAERA